MRFTAPLALLFLTATAEVLRDRELGPGVVVEGTYLQGLEKRDCVYNGCKCKGRAYLSRTWNRSLGTGVVEPGSPCQSMFQRSRLKRGSLPASPLTFRS